LTEREWLGSTRPEKLLRWLDSTTRADRKPTHRGMRLFVCACCRSLWDKLKDQRLRDSVETAELFADGEATERQLELAHKMACPAVSKTHSSAPNEYFCVWAALMTSKPGDRFHDFLTELERCPSDDHPLPKATQLELIREIFGNPFRPAIADCNEALDGSCEAHGCDFQKTGEATSICPGGRGWFRTRIACTPTVRDLALASYMDRSSQDRAELDPSRLLVLADALEEAGMRPVTGRTVSQVVQARQQAVMGGCCERFADHSACDCLELAVPDGVLEHLRSPGPHYRGCWALDFVLGR